MTPKLLFDATYYIQAFRERRPGVQELRVVRQALVYYSTVVGAELLRGAHDPKLLQLIEKNWRDARKSRRLVVPGGTDWHDTGTIIRQIAAKYNYESLGKHRIVHDALIAMSARRLGIAVVTHNVVDYERIAEFRSLKVISAKDFKLP